MHKLKSHKEGKVAFMALKLDMSKAYNRVEWQFLQKVMQIMGFHQRWINLVIRCVSLMSFSVLINDKKIRVFSPFKKLQARGPTVPLPFPLVY